MPSPSPHRSERARLTHSVPHLTGSLKPVRLSTAVSCPCWWNSAFPPAFSISGSVQVTPRFPPAGPDGHGSPPSTVLSERYDFLLPHVLRLIVSPAGSAGACRGSCPPWGAPVAAQDRRRAGGLDCSRWPSRSSVLARGQEQDLPGSLAIHPVTLRRSTTPDDPLHLAVSGASGAAPTQITMKASLIAISRLRDASSPAVYASRRALPRAMQDSLSAGGLRLCRAGAEPAGSLRAVSGHLILLSRASPSAIPPGSRRVHPRSGSPRRKFRRSGPFAEVWAAVRKRHWRW